MPDMRNDSGCISDNIAEENDANALIHVFGVPSFTPPPGKRRGYV